MKKIEAPAGTIRASKIRRSIVATTPAPSRVWANLNRRRPLRPITDDADLDRALAIVDRLLRVPETGRTRDQADYLFSISLLIEAYEDRHHAIPVRASPLQALENLMEANGMNASDLGRLLGDRSLGSKILRSERNLSKGHIRKLCKRFKLRPETFLGET